MRVVVVVDVDAYAACLQLPIETGRTLICAEFLEKKFDSLPEVGKNLDESNHFSEKRQMFLSHHRCFFPIPCKTSFVRIARFIDN